MKKRKASSLIYIIFFLVIFLAFAAFAVDGTIIFTYRSKLQNITEMTALAAASEFNYPSYVTSSEIETKAQNIFNLLKQDSLKTAGITAVADATTKPKKITITTSMISEPFFLAFLGISGIKLEAKASAISEELPITANYSGINWVTASAAYLSDILSKNLNLNDTAILAPLGGFESKISEDDIEAEGFKSASISYSGTKKKGVIFSLINSNENQPLSLGPGGFITIKLPAPIIDKPGDDLFIKEAGDALEGYMVFAGLDKNPDKPYVDVDNQGEGISWINISSSGTPFDSALGSQAHQTANTQLSVSIQDKFYGSGYFDIGKSGISMAKYIRIIDDNQESGFINTNGTYYKTMLYGEASSATSGADIDNVTVLNHVKLQ